MTIEIKSIHFFFSDKKITGIITASPVQNSAAIFDVKMYHEEYIDDLNQADIDELVEFVKKLGYTRIYSYYKKLSEFGFNAVDPQIFIYPVYKDLK